MRKIEIEISGDKKVEVRELKVKDVRAILKKVDEMNEGASAEGLIDLIGELAPNFTSLKAKQIDDLTFSQIRKIKDAFMEVNSDFLEILESLGMDLKGMKIESKVAGNKVIEEAKVLAAS